MKSRCLLVIDVQNDFCTGSLAIAQATKIIAPINSLMRNFKTTIACQDWHPKNHKSFASYHKKSAGEVIDLMGVKQVLWEDHCIQNTIGSDFPQTLQTQYFQKIFLKGANSEIDSYSAFYDMARKSSTGLTKWLKEQQIQEVYMVGLATDYCVKFSALDALKDGFEVIVIQDLCRAVNLQNGDEQAAILQMKKQGARVVIHNQLVF